MNLANVFFYLFIIIFALGNIYRIPVSANQALNLFYLFVLTTLPFLLFVIFKNKKKVKPNKYAKLIVVFFAWLFITFLANLGGKNFSQILIAFAYPVRLLFYFVFALLVSRMAKLRVRNMFVFATFCMLVLGILQYVIFPDLTQLKYLGWDDHYFRLAGSLLDPNFSGIVFLAGAIILVNTYEKKIFVRPINYYQIILLLFGIGLALTFSRGTWLITLIILFLIALKQKRIKFVILTVFVIALSYLFAPKPFGEGVNILRTSTIDARITNYRQAVDEGLERPIIGRGYNFVRKSSANIYPDHAIAGYDNSFLYIFVTSGAIGLFLFILLIVNILVTGWNNNFLLFLLTLAFSLHSFFYNSFFYPYVLVIFLLFAVREYRKA